ncbi:MAG: hypothetical protein Q4C54_00075 [Clostridia bacterium]|nr:hypothetical protein [Clostridia bacterium]
MMKRTALFVLVCALCAFLPVMMLLVEGPADAPQTAADEAQPAGRPQMMAAVDVSASAGVPLFAEEKRPVRNAALPVIERAEGAEPVCDGNYIPMTGRTYIKTVYQAFPPESLPG